MADWPKHALIAILVGYQICVFGTVTSSGGGNNQPLIIIAFLFFSPAAVLAALVKLGDLSANAVISICTIVFLIIAGESSN
jgi:hypothetical protein